MTFLLAPPSGQTRHYYLNYWHNCQYVYFICFFVTVGCNEPQSPGAINRLLSFSCFNFWFSKTACAGLGVMKCKLCYSFSGLLYRFHCVDSQVGFS